MAGSWNVRCGEKAKRVTQFSVHCESQYDGYDSNPMEKCAVTSFPTQGKARPILREGKVVKSNRDYDPCRFSAQRPGQHGYADMLERKRALV